MGSSWAVPAVEEDPQVRGIETLLVEEGAGVGAGEGAGGREGGEGVVC